VWTSVNALGAGGGGSGGVVLGGNGLSGLGGGGRTRGSNDGLNAMAFSNPVAAPSGMTPVKEVSDKKESVVTLSNGSGSGSSSSSGGSISVVGGSEKDTAARVYQQQQAGIDR